MRSDNDLFRDTLLSHLPQPGDLAQYRSEVAALIASNEKRIRREALLVRLFWIFCVACAIAWIWFGPAGAVTLRSGFLACIFFMWGALEVLKHYINSCRIDLMKEIKQIQVQVLELRAK